MDRVKKKAAFLHLILCLEEKTLFLARREERPTIIHRYKNGGITMKPYNKSNIPLTQALRKEQTKWEKHLWYDFLSIYPIRFQRQKAIDNFIVDFYCAKAQLVVELDGYYHTLSHQAEDDTERTAKLKSLGLEVIRFTNTEIERDFNLVCKIIDSSVTKRIK